MQINNVTLLYISSAARALNSLAGKKTAKRRKTCHLEDLRAFASATVGTSAFWLSPLSLSLSSNSVKLSKLGSADKR